jgi:acetolactate synthase small subunit
MVYGYVIINLNEKKIYTQWAVKDDQSVNWLKGEDIVINIDPDNEKEIKQLLQGIRIKYVDIDPDRIWLWCESNENLE